MLLQSLILEYADKIGLPDDQLRMLIGIITSTIFGFAFKQIENQRLRVYSGLLVGLFLTYFVYDQGMLNIMLQNIIVYSMIKLQPDRPWLVFIETMLFVAAHHIERQYNDYGGWRLDVTTALMMNTAKWTSFAFCAADGRKQSLSEEQKQRKIAKLPSFVEYSSYIFFFAGTLCGPAYDYHDYQTFVSRSQEYTSIPSTIKETLRLLINAVICMSIFMGLKSYFPFDYVATAEFGQLNIFQQTLWFNIMIMIQRCKYYGGFLFAELSIASSGLTYGGHGFQKIKSIDLDWDLTYNMKDKVEKWNISIQTWLRRYVYTRIYSEEEMKNSAKKQAVAYQLTYAVSAVWHGFYPGYYCSFFFWAIENSVNKSFFKASLNTAYFRIFEKNLILQVIRWYLANTLFNIFGITFLLLSIDKILNFYNNMYWIPHIIMFALYFFFAFTGFGAKKQKK